MEPIQTKNILEAALMAAGKTLSLEQMIALFDDNQKPTKADTVQLLNELAADYEGRGMMLAQVASGYRIQVRSDYAWWVSRLWEEKPAKYSRAMLETLAIIAYRQPITRAEIEDIRGVAVSSSIVKTLIEREWVRVVGQRDVPGRPSMLGTTRQFLDYFNLTSLDDLPTLAELRDIEDIGAHLEATLNAESGEKPEEVEVSHDVQLTVVEGGQQSPVTESDDTNQSAVVPLVLVANETEKDNDGEG